MTLPRPAAMLLKHAAATFDRGRFRLLLGLQILLFLLSPVVQDTVWGDPLVTIYSAGLFAGAIHATHPAGLVRLVGYTICSLWVLAVIIIPESQATTTFRLTTSLILTGLVTFSTFNALFSDARNDVDSLCGAIFGYLLLALIWAQLYGAAEHTNPGSFIFPEADHLHSQLLYFSLVTITTLGYGDVLPLSPVVRIMAGFEAALGTLYVAVMIGRIVSVFTPVRDRKRGREGRDE